MLVALSGVVIILFPLFFPHPSNFIFRTFYIAFQDPVRFLPSIGYLSTYREPIDHPKLKNVGASNTLLEPKPPIYICIIHMYSSIGCLYT